MDPRISEIAAVAGIDLVKTEPLPGGEQGAWELVESAGSRFIVKIHPNESMLRQYQRAADTAARLRRNSYPTPRYIAAGTIRTDAYAVIEKLDGMPNRPVTISLLEQLISLNRKQHHAACEPNSDWVSELLDSLMHGCADYCQVESLEDHSRDTRALLVRLQAIATQTGNLNVNIHDIVHYDFTPANVLSDRDQVTGIIDWDGTRTGDGMFDLSTLLFYCADEPTVRTRLTDAILDRSGPEALRLYLAHMILRQIDWSIRHHDRETVDLYLLRSQRLLEYVSGDP